MEEFWQELQCHVDFDGVGGVDRFLGWYHEFKKDSVGLHMNRHAQQSVELYLSLPGVTPLKNVQSSFVADGSLGARRQRASGVDEAVVVQQTV